MLERAGSVRQDSFIGLLCSFLETSAGVSLVLLKFDQEWEK